MLAPIPPSTFLDRLDSAFNGRVRLRWSAKKAVWCIEEKVGRGALPPFRLDPWDDSHIQARDGYALALEIAPTNFRHCAYCNQKLSLPTWEAAEVRCPACMARGRDARWQGVYIPLGDKLIELLRMSSPEVQDQIKRVREREAAAIALKEREAAAGHREAREQLKDGLIDQLPKAGFPSLVPDGWRH